LVHFSHFGTMYQRKIWQPWLCRDESEIINEFDHGNLWELLFLMGTTFLLFLNLKDSTLVAEWIQGDQIGRSNFAYFLLAGFWQWRMYIDHVLGYFLSTEKLWFILTRIGLGHFLGHFSPTHPVALNGMRPSAVAADVCQSGFANSDLITTFMREL
jgi:hypothetical protein